jgi:hypothetical protein
MACLKRSDLAERGVCPRFTQPRRQLISAPPCTLQPLARTATKNRFGRFEPSRVISSDWRINSLAAA